MKEFEGALLGFTTGIVGELENARDIVQETFLKLYEQEPGRISEQGLKAWLYTVCRNRALDSLRRRKRLVSLEDDTLAPLPSHDPLPDEVAAQHEESAAVLRFLKRLPPNQQEVIRLKFHGDLSYKEISAVTGLTTTNVGFLIHTALHRLRQMLEHEIPATR